MQALLQNPSGSEDSCRKQLNSFSHPLDLIQIPYFHVRWFVFVLRQRSYSGVDPQQETSRVGIASYSEEEKRFARPQAIRLGMAQNPWCLITGL